MTTASYCPAGRGVATTSFCDASRWRDVVAMSVLFVFLSCGADRPAVMAATAPSGKTHACAQFETQGKVVGLENSSKIVCAAELIGNGDVCGVADRHGLRLQCWDSTLQQTWKRAVHCFESEFGMSALWQVAGSSVVAAFGENASSGRLVMLGRDGTTKAEKQLKYGFLHGIAADDDAAHVYLTASGSGDCSRSRSSACGEWHRLLVFDRELREEPAIDLPGYPGHGVVSVGPDGDVFVAGTASSGAVGTRTIAASAGRDGYVARLSREGEVRWIKQWSSGADGSIEPKGIAVNQAGKVAVYGGFSHSLKTSVNTLRRARPVCGGFGCELEGFVALVDENGADVWARQFNWEPRQFTIVSALTVRMGSLALFDDGRVGIGADVARGGNLGRGPVDGLDEKTSRVLAVYGPKGELDLAVYGRGGEAVAFSRGHGDEGPIGVWRAEQGWISRSSVTEKARVCGVQQGTVNRVLRCYTAWCR
jgi:hypothetical protein